MCTGLELALVAGGTAAQSHAQNQARRDQMRQADADIERNQRLSREAGKRVGDEVQALQKSTPDAEREAAQAGFMDALRKQAITGEGGLEAPGAASARFEDEAGIARTAGRAENRGTAAQLARIDAPQYQRLREGQGRSATASDLSLIENRGAGQDFLSRLKMSLIQPNQGLMAAGSALSNYGMASAGRAKPRQIPRTVDSTLPSGAY